jgi:hypothetical protein
LGGKWVRQILKTTQGRKRVARPVAFRAAKNIPGGLDVRVLARRGRKSTIRVLERVDEARSAIGINLEKMSK